MLSKEVDKMTKDDEDKAKDAEKANAKGGKKSPRKSRELLTFHVMSCCSLIIWSVRI